MDMPAKRQGDSKKKGKRANGEGTCFQRADGTWEAQISLGRDQEGKWRRRSFYGKTQKEALQKRDAARSQLQAGTYTDPTKLTVGVWLDRWLMEHKVHSLRPTTFDSYSTTARTHLQKPLGHIQLQDLHPEHIQRLYNDKLAGGTSGRLVRYMHQVLHGALGQAVKNGWLSRNPSDAVTLPRHEAKPCKPLTREQVKHLLSSTLDNRLHGIIVLAATAGLRLGEILALKWDDIDFEGRSLRVQRTLERVRLPGRGPNEKKSELTFQEPKTKTSIRSVPLVSIAVEVLQSQMELQQQDKQKHGAAYHDEGLVFATEDGGRRDPRIRAHDLRHTYASLMLSSGQNPKVVMEILGHARISMTLDTYSHVMPEMKRAAADDLQRILEQK
jgi:integrase